MRNNIINKDSELRELSYNDPIIRNAYGMAQQAGLSDVQTLKIAVIALSEAYAELKTQHIDLLSRSTQQIHIK